VSLDNADAVIEGAPSLTLFKGGVLGLTSNSQKIEIQKVSLIRGASK